MALKHIKQLSQDVIGQIAAGEVVERPSAAIKELVENSMDAGATAITVEIRDGGLTSFRIVDNGSGIQPSDIRLAFERHATSKIATAADLYSVETLGFRGEALASIAAVSKLTCTTRTKDADFGISVQNNGGVISEIKEAACPEGTSFTVKDLFYNAPVRRKFMKKPSTETGYVSDLMLRFILSHPQISFRYIADGKTVYFSAGDGKLESAVMSIYGLDTLGKLQRVSGRMNGLLLDGYVGVGELARGNRTHQTFILNGRMIKSNLLTLSLEEACRQRVMIGRFPICILHLTMPFEQADVNVHPNKWEVRFQNELGIREAVTTLIQDAWQQKTTLESTVKLFDEKTAPISSVKITASAPEIKSVIKTNITPTINTQHSSFSIPDSNINRNKVHNAKTNPSINNDTISNISNDISKKLGSKDGFSKPHSLHSSSEFLVPDRKYASEKPVSKPEITKDTPQSIQNPVETVVQKTQVFPIEPIQTTVIQEEIEQVTDQKIESVFSELPVRMIGVIFNTYIILECNDRMLLCDQHAVHERLLFERMMKACEADTASQMLLTPALIKLTHREYEVFLDSQDALKAAGFDAADFGDLSVQLRAVPMVLGTSRSTDCFRDALDELADGRQITNQKRTERIIQMACKHAVKGGEKLPEDGLFELVRRMITDNVTPTCPHGRPLIIEVTHRDLDKRFRRIQN
ncbi:MAG: DNA mismatch repair endonuclease MutL [Clostridia bacterium]|nr:DNA mismatch repair endonuclease MutL [Clostridia bacterium]